MSIWSVINAELSLSILMKHILRSIPNDGRRSPVATRREPEGSRGHQPGNYRSLLPTSELLDPPELGGSYLGSSYLGAPSELPDLEERCMI